MQQLQNECYMGIQLKMNAVWDRERGIMLHLKYTGEEKEHKIGFARLNDHVVCISGDLPAETKGFTLSRPGHGDGWDYTAYSTVYRTVDGAVLFSDDGSVYTEPVPTVVFRAGTGGTLYGDTVQCAGDYGELEPPEPVAGENYIFTGWAPELPGGGKVAHGMEFVAEFAYVETLEEAKEKKAAEMGAMKDAAIRAGTSVTLTDGTVEHFELGENEQKILAVLQGKVAAGEGDIPWHTSDEAEHCKFYSNADMALITSAALKHVTWHETYFRDLRIFIRAAGTKGEVEAVTYGMEIPEAYRSGPLKAMMAAMAV